jgi:hypothetical protein
MSTRRCPDLSEDMSSSSVTSSRRQKTTEDLLHWRRLQVIKLLSQGHTIDGVADILKLSAKTIQRDHAYVRAHSKQMMREYFADTMPNEMLKVIARLTAVSDEAWELARLAKQGGQHKLRQDSLRLAKDTAMDIAGIVIDNPSIIDAARAAEQREDQLKGLESTEPEVEEEEEEKEEEENNNDEIILSEDKREESADSDPERIF